MNHGVAAVFLKMKLISLLSTLVFANVHYIRGNDIRIPLSIYNQGLREGSYVWYFEADQRFYGTISIGTPPQKINVLFSTAYNSIYVVSSYCNSSICQNHNTYNHENSTTFRGQDDFDNTIRQGYGKATDTITIGNFQIQDVSFVVTTSGEDYDNKPWDGIVGLYPGSLFIKSCEKLGLKKKFSFYTNSPWDNNTSELMLCGEDKTKFRGNLQNLTVGTENGLLRIKIQSVMLHHNHENVLKMEFRNEIRELLFEFETSYIIGPAGDVKKIYDKLNIKRTSKIGDDLKEVDCNNIDALPSITFVTADSNFTLTGNDYIKQMTHNDKQVCIVRLLSHSLNSWRIGSIFFRKYYTVFYDEKPRRIGFAESVHPPAKIMVFLF
ncbi:cathepsin E-like [Planococcus citri]|uniref:cathepsin E-like n=1 Tax=Planococcus citri TaxID=170843 RepID=UPI0031F88396